LFNSKVYCLAGDGCMMEGISSEASSLAGHLKLDNLVLIYDSNKICLDGPTFECLSENTKMRYTAYGWDTIELDGYNFETMQKAFTEIRDHQTRPTLVILHTIIGKGSPHKAGTHQVHGSPLGPEEVEATKKALGLPEEDFFVAPVVMEFFAERLKKSEELEREWNKLFEKWKIAHPELAQDFDKMVRHQLPSDLEEKLAQIEMKSPLAGRRASQIVLETLGSELPQLIGGSGDLSCSDLTMMKKFPIITEGNFQGRNIKYGVREFAMATAATGLYETQMLIPFIGTFLTFSDYMRNAIRLAALSGIQVIYQFTHDSIFLGEDGPTHQPVEHYAALRAIPKLQVIRPADNWEVKMAWVAALHYKGPTAILLSRQALPDLIVTHKPYREGMGRGAYIVRHEKKTADYTLFATGSELSLALDVATALEHQGKSVRVVSMPCWELFEAQDSAYQASIVGGNLGKRVSIEAGVSFGWQKWIGFDGIAISIETFGASAPQADLAAEFGFTVDAVLNKLRK
ncbi:MAG: transketolase family protein, partial [Rhabdochlamydiaceae bacterium]